MQDFFPAFQEVIEDIAIGEVERRLRWVETKAYVAKQKYAADLAEMVIGSNAKPPLGEFTPSKWDPLTENWLKRKRTTKSRPEYYLGLTGKLSQDIRSMSRSSQLFGAIKTTSGKDVSVDNRGFYNPRIKRQIQTVYRDTRGRFSSSKLAGSKGVVYRIDAFPELSDSGVSLDKIVDALPISFVSKRKLIGNDAKRPFLVNFTLWFAKHRVNFAIEQELKNQGLR